MGWALCLGARLVASAQEPATEPRQTPAAGEPAAAVSADGIGAFLRFVPAAPNEGHLDTAIKHYERGADGVRVSLGAVVHVGDAAYYDEFQRRFETYDAVLYEMIRDRDVEVERKPDQASPVSQLQIGMKNLLELTFQLDRIDYARANFVHADLDPESFARLQAERGETILGLLFKAALEEQQRMAADPSSGINPFAFLFALTSRDRGPQLKYMLGRQMSQMEGALAGLDTTADGKGSAILSGRNEHAVGVLREQIAKGRRRLILFYGAGHMPDLEKRLLAMDFKPAGEDWLVAWEIRKKRTVEGWDVRIGDALWREQPAATRRALELLQTQLAAVRRDLPAAAVEGLQEIPLWFNLARPGDKPRAEYHPDAQWLRDHGRDPAMAKAIEFTDIPEFEKETRRMPNFVLHELAHAYHDRVLGFDHPGILAAFERARRGGRYDDVKRWTGERETRERAYAMTDAKEYFAETTEAMFGRNDFEPFTREELREIDPGMYRLLAELWGVSVE